MVLVVVALFVLDAEAQTPPLQSAGVVALSGVTGRIDHLAFDPATGHLYVAALGHDTIEVIDTTQRRHLRSLSGFHEPQGLAIVPDANGMAVANGGTGTLQLIDAKSLGVRWTTEVGGDADNVRYDALRKRIMVAAEGGLYSVDPATGKVTDHISISGHPESFQLEASGRVFANLPGEARIVAGDRLSSSVAAHWPTGACGANYPMVLDEDAARLFVGCRRPASVVVVDDRTGAIKSTAATVGDTDDMFYDASRRRLYVIGGEGAVDV
jgi:DNA-binding beta-propeller fold protein YncE